MKKLVRFLDGLLKGGIIMTTLIMVVASTLQVLTRFVLPHPYSWTEELARYSFIWWSFIGAAYVVRLNAHLGMDILVNLLPGRAQVFIQKLVFLLCLAFCVLATVNGVKITIVQAGQLGTILPISMAWVYAIVPFTSAVMTLYLVYLLLFWTPPRPEAVCDWLPEEAPASLTGPVQEKG